MMLLVSNLKSLCRFVRIPRAACFHNAKKRFGCRPVFVLNRGLCDSNVPPTKAQGTKSDTACEGRYVGDTRNGLRCGRGECWDKIGHYNGEWVSDVREGHGVLSYVNGIIYEGGFIDNLPNEHGKLTWPDGTVYEGMFVDGILRDDTRLVTVDGLCLEGTRIFGQLNGFGKMKSAKGGLVLEGVFCSSGIVRKAVITFADGSVHEGELDKEFRLHGKGKITSKSSGVTIEGMFREGEPCGWCKFQFSDGTVLEGIRRDGAWVGKMKSTLSSGATCEGAYLDGDKHGLWTYHLISGVVLEGHCRNGVEYGPWTITMPNGETVRNSVETMDSLVMNFAIPLVSDYYEMQYVRLRQVYQQSQQK